MNSSLRIERPIQDSRTKGLALVWLTFLWLLLAACGGKEPEQLDGCIPGRVDSCVCETGAQGMMSCDDGAWSACLCDGFAPTDAGYTADVADGADIGDIEEQRPLNTCGGFRELGGVAGQRCGECADGTLVCDGEDLLKCIGARTRNTCGGCGPLPAAIGDLCGKCGQGRWQCGGAGEMICVDDKPLNTCGGCGDLEEERGFACSLDGQIGTWQCLTRNELLCLIPGRNGCGGTAALAGVPGTACGSCSGGRWVCTGSDAVVCDVPETGVNACGGCAPLSGVLGEPCGECGGQWQCDGTERVKCSAPLNLCGACGPLAASPGDSCGEGLIQACRGQDSVGCVDAGTTNVCGGQQALTAMPGSPCGPCMDGYHICASTETVVCIDAKTRLNACDGCTELSASPREICGVDQIWLCDDSGARLHCTTLAEVEANACGGTSVLTAQPGDTCEACGEWGCSSFDLERLVCMNGSTGLDRDRFNCGSCGRVCGDDEGCFEGDCVLDTVVAIDAGQTHTCALRASGRVYCWGSGASGRLGTRTTENQLLPAQVFGLDDAVELAVGSRFACARRETGDVACWGFNNAVSSRSYLMLGLGSSQIYEVYAPIDIPGLHGLRSIKAGPGFACGIDPQNRAVCWGVNTYGQLGRGSFSDALPPGVVPGLEGVTELAIGGFDNQDGSSSGDISGHVCARLSSGEVYCWGRGQFGQNGRDDGEHSAVPVKIDGIEDAVSIGASVQASCAVLAAGELWCWGSSEGSQLARAVKRFGIPCFDPSGCYQSIRQPPTLAPTAMVPARITGSMSNYNCAVTDEGELWCWGMNDFGRFGLGNTTRQDVPVAIDFYGDEGRKVIDVAAGRHHLCVLVDSGQVYCAGRADVGGARLLGDAQLATRAMDRTRPVPVIGLVPDTMYEQGQCRDGIDNNGNGAIDCADAGCATDLGNTSLIDIAGSFDSSEGNFFQGSCGTTNGREHVYSWTAPTSGSFVFSTEGSAMINTLYVLSTCDASVIGAELGCDSFSGEGSRARLTLEVTAGQRYAVIVDSSAQAAPGTYQLRIFESP
jgi:alpha-tubulin suppressor-like RCC1 family protein